MIDFYGTPVITDEWLVDRVQFRFPRTKKKRIRKKWAKRAENYRSVAKKEIYQVGGSLVYHPATLKRFCEENDIQVVAGYDNLLHLEYNNFAERVSKKQDESVVRRISQVLGAWDGIFTQNTMCGGITREYVIDALKLMPKMKRDRPWWDLLSMQEPDFGCAIEDGEMVFKRERYEVKLPDSPFLLNCF